MDFFQKDRYGSSEVYDIYTKNIRGVHFDVVEGIQIVYVIDKQIKYFLYGEEIIAKKGDVLILNQCENRFLYSDNKENLCIVLNIHSEFLNTLDINYSDIRFNNIIKRNSLNAITMSRLLSIYNDTISSESIDKIKQDIIDILDTLRENNLNTNIVINNLQNKRNYLFGINNLIKNMEIKKLNLRYLSEKLNLSQSYISKLFYDLSGTKFTDYMQQFKLSSAIIYLLKTTYNIEKITSLVDFESTKSINRIFKKYLKISPSVYREHYNYNVYEENQNKKLKNIIKRIDIETYQEYIDLYSNDRENEYLINTDILHDNTNYTGEEVLKNWQLIRNLQSLGPEYIQGFKEVLNSSKVSGIILKFGYDYEKEKYYLTDINKYISLNSIYEILNICVENDIQATIQLTLGDIDEDSDIDLQMKRRLKLHNEFYELLFNAVGNTNMKKFRHSILLSGLIKYSHNAEVIRKIELNISYIVKYFTDKLGAEEYILGYNLGVIDNTNVDSWINISKNNIKKFKKPYFLIMKYNNTEVFNPINYSNLDKMKKYIKKCSIKLLEIEKEFSNTTDEIHIKDILTFLDITEVKKDYRDLFMLMIMLEVSFELQKTSFIAEYQAVDKREKNELYQPVVIDMHEFFSPIFFAIKILNQLEGKIIYNKNRCLVTLNDRDFYIITYGDLKVDYLFAHKKNFNDLDKYKAKLRLKFNNLQGRYKIITEVLSYEHGTVESTLRDFQNKDFLTQTEKDYVKRITVPKIDIKIKDMDGEYTEIVEYSPFNIIIKKLIKI